LKFYPTGGWCFSGGSGATCYGGICGNPDRGAGINQPGPFQYNILPYMEQSAVYQLSANKTGTNLQAAVITMLQTPISAFNCPSRRQAKVYPNQTVVGSNTQNIGCGSKVEPLAYVCPDNAAKSDYVCNGGQAWLNMQDMCKKWGPNAVSSPYPIATPFDVDNMLANDKQMVKAWLSIIEGGGGGDVQTVLGVVMKFPGTHGISYLWSTVAAGDVLDGTSNTYLAGEKYLDPDLYEAVYAATAPMVKGYGDFPLLGGQVNSSMRWSQGTAAGSATTQPYRDTPGYNSYHGFGAIHAGGFNMAFCDGSVRSISYGVDRWVNVYLSNRKDSQIVDPAALSF